MICTFKASLSFQIKLNTQPNTFFVVDHFYVQFSLKNAPYIKIDPQYCTHGACNYFHVWLILAFFSIKSSFDKPNQLIFLKFVTTFGGCDFSLLVVTNLFKVYQSKPIKEQNQKRIPQQKIMICTNIEQSPSKEGGHQCQRLPFQLLLLPHMGICWISRSKRLQRIKLGPFL